MFYLTCTFKVQAIRAVQAQEDSTMTWHRAWVAHIQVCGADCGARNEEAFYKLLDERKGN